jgi:osmoprotectant transport system substrate-binding protein
MARALWVLLALALSGCVSPSEPSPASTVQAAEPEQAIVVGSFDFPESILLAHVYAGALAGEGFPVRLQPGLGTREVVMPALLGGLVHLVPEYAGSALGFLSLGEQAGTADVAATHAALARWARERELVVASPAPAQDTNAIVVTSATAQRHRLRSIADLAAVDQDLVFGGPPECPQRQYCLRGLERTYGLTFGTFVPTDAGGALTRQALSSGQIDVGLLFTTDANLSSHELVVLADDRGLQPAENVTPLLRAQVVARFGQDVLDTLDEVSARLTTEVLRSLNAAVEAEGATAQDVAEDWLGSQGLAVGVPGAPQPSGRAVP